MPIATIQETIKQTKDNISVYCVLVYGYYFKGSDTFKMTKNRFVFITYFTKKKSCKICPNLFPGYSLVNKTSFLNEYQVHYRKKKKKK